MKAHELKRHLTELPFRGGNSAGARLGRYAVAVAITLLAWLTTTAPRTPHPAPR